MPGADSMASVQSVWIEIDDHEIGREPLFDGGEDALDAGLRDKAERSLRKPQPRSAKANLVGGFFTGEIKRAVALGGDGRGSLQQERRFADARLAAQEHRRALREAVADGPVEFADAGSDALQSRPASARFSIVAAFALRFALRPTAPGAERALPSWERLFHVPQDGHLPCHLLLAAPQDWQT